MANTKSKNKRIAESLLLLSIVGVASSLAFVFTAVASGIVPSQVIALANSARSQAGLATLSENAKLSEAARAKANDMIKNDYFAHTSPKGIEPWYWIKQANYQYKAAGENLAINYADAVEQHAAWMKSETHRANIMNTRYQEIGVAVASGKINGKESIVTVEYFGTPLYAVSDQATPLPPAPGVIPAEIKGAETAETPSPTVPVVSAPASVVYPRAPFVEMSWLEIAAIGLLSLSTALMPIVFLSQALRVLLVKKGLKEAKKQTTLMVIPVIASLNIDSIHHNLPAH